MLTPVGNRLKINNLQEEASRMSVAQAIPSAVESEAGEESKLSAPSHESSEFWRNHPSIAADILYILDVYARCERVDHRNGAPELEAVYSHVFGSAETDESRCEYCYPAFQREKRIVEALSPR
jgi:hypothetical protein